MAKITNWGQDSQCSRVTTARILFNYRTLQCSPHHICISLSRSRMKTSQTINWTSETAQAISLIGTIASMSSKKSQADLILRRKPRSLHSKSMSIRHILCYKSDFQGSKSQAHSRLLVEARMFDPPKSLMSIKADGRAPQQTTYTLTWSASM